MAINWNKIEEYLDQLVEKNMFNVELVHKKQQQIISLISDLKSTVAEPDKLIDNLLREIENITQQYAEQMLSQLDSAEGMLETLAQTKATIDKDLSLKKTLELEIVQLSARKRGWKKLQKKRQEEELHKTSQPSKNSA